MVTRRRCAEIPFPKKTVSRGSAKAQPQALRPAPAGSKILIPSLQPYVFFSKSKSLSGSKSFLPLKCCFFSISIWIVQPPAFLKQFNDSTVQRFNSFFQLNGSDPAGQCGSTCQLGSLTPLLTIYEKLYFLCDFASLREAPLTQGTFLSVLSASVVNSF
jgi:hypothetical protein